MLTSLLLLWNTDPLQWQAQEDPSEFNDFGGFDSGDEEVIEGEEAPELVPREEIEVKDERPRKKQRRG